MALCECGCGGQAPITRGGPKRFIHNHHHRLIDHAGLFWAKVDKSPGQGPRGDCWTWIGTKNEDGYGILTIKGRRQKAHRVAYDLTYAPLGHREAGHSCDNPPCVRPIHIFPTDRAENMADMVRKGRSSRGERRYNARLTESAVIEIRALCAVSTPQKDVARRFKISPSIVSEIASRKRWAHV